MSNRGKRRREALQVILSGLCLFVASRPTKAATTDRSIDCSLRAKKVDALFVIQGVATSHVNVSGRYEVIIRKKNNAGISQNVQQGTFSLQPGTESILTTVAMEEEAEGHVSASMTLDTNFGRMTCLFPQ